MKVTTTDIAFALESIAHLNNDPRIKPHVGKILLAALLVREATDEQLAAALDKQLTTPFYGATIAHD